MTTQGKSDDTMLAMKEVQRRLGIGYQAMRNLIDRDEDFITLKVGGRRMMRAHRLEEFIHAKESQSRPDRTKE